LKKQGTGSRFKRWFSALLGISLSGLFLYLAFGKVNLGQVRTALASARLAWLAPMIAILLVSFWLRAVRWARMFPSSSRPKAGQAFNALMIGALANNVVAGRVGDVARAGLIAQVLPQVGAGGALATVVLEKVMDGLVLVALLGIALVTVPLPIWVARMGYLAAVLFLGALSVLFVMSLRSRPESHPAIFKENGYWTAKANAILHWFLSRFVGGLTPLRQTSHFLMLMVLTFVIWLCDITLMFSAFQALGLVLPFVAAIVGVVLLALGLMIPAGPGFIGTYQFFVVTALGLYKVSESQALATALFLNLFVLVLSSLLGLFALVVGGFSWSSWTGSNREAA
jgi:uncharacterized protein (TIRG00374 family)